jgi:hypothetical protein
MTEVACPHCGCIIPDEERSDKAHRLYFACLAAGYDNLPEHLAGTWATSEALRAELLIDTGYFTMVTFNAKTAGEAKRVARWMTEQEPRSRVDIIHDKIVTIKRARSQRYGQGGMGKKEFKESSDAVLLALSKLIGVDVVLLKTQGLHYEAPAA